MAIEFEIFQHEPDTTEAPTVRWMQAADALTVSPFREFIAWPDEDPQRAYTFRYSFTERNPLLSAKDFFSRHGGSAKAFLLPSWERDWTPAAAPVAGALEIEVEGIDWLDSYPIHHPDGPGRYGFIFDVVEGFHAFRITAAEPAAPTTTRLTIEQALPFTPGPDALYGWLHVARFAGDDAEWMHHAPQAASVDLGFVTTRQRITKDEADAADGLEVYASKPIKTVEAEQGPPPFARFDVAYAWGPLNLRVAQSATFQTRWAAWIAADGVRLLKNATDGEIIPPDTSQGFLSELFSSPPDTSHVSLCFDQLSYETIAWQHDSTTARIRKRTSGALTTYEFTGNDPVLFYNGNVAVEERLDGESDVVCYYRKPGQSVVFARYQRDAFEIEYKAAGLPFLPIYLMGADHDASNRTFSISYLDNGYRACVATCEPYPEPPEIPPDPYVALELQESAATAAVLPDFAHDEIIIVPPSLTDSARIAGNLADLENFEALIIPPDTTEPQQVGASIADIAYESVIVSAAAPTEAASGLASIANIAYDLTVPPTEPEFDTTAAAASIANIAYEIP